MKTRHYLPLALITLAACAHGPQPVKVVTQEVRVAVPVKCDAKVSAEPNWSATETALKTGDAATMLQHLYASYRVARAYIAEQRAAIEGCAKP